jgi:protein transport protein SEC61 subunit gamma-like protein
MIKDFFHKCIRVLKVTKKPSKQEYLTIVKMSGLGILIVGLLGFLIYMANVMFQ